MKALVCCLVWVVLVGFGFGQEVGDPRVERNLSALKAISEPIGVLQGELARLADELAVAETEQAKLDVQAKIEAERERLEQLRENFREIVGGSEAAGYAGDEVQGNANLQEQISELLQPVIGELREASSKPREMDALRRSLDEWTERKAKADVVIARIEVLLEKAKDGVVLAELESARKLWGGRQAEAGGQIEVLSVQIEEREQNAKSMWETFSRLFSDFFRSRGLNLLVALIAALAGFMVTRRLYRWVCRFSPMHRKAKGGLMSRLSDVLAMTLSVVIAVLAVLLVFYVRNDWLLLTLAVILLIGALWGARNALPPYFNQVRLLLNLGPVREGERVVYLGVPWKVTSLGFLTRFTNPSLQGGELKVPIDRVMGMISREADVKEPWFPTEQDDWVVLSDGKVGKVVNQSPEQVVLVFLGGSLKTYPVWEFLEALPENLSKGFRVSVMFGIDYRHQAVATSEAPGIFQQALEVGLYQELGREQVRSIQVEFAGARVSSLEFEVLADFDGSAASRYRAIHRRIQRICVEVCGERGWTIPFTQVVVHQAAAER